jgi:hypothetical protein
MSQADTDRHDPSMRHVSSSILDRRDTTDVVMSSPLATLLPSRRRSLRHRVVKGGTITFADQRGALPCIVSDLSDTGARLRVFDPTIVPDRFDLTINIDRVRATCTVRWRRRFEIGVAFEAQAAQVRPGEPQRVAPPRPPAGPKPHPGSGSPPLLPAEHGSPAVNPPARSFEPGDQSLPQADIDPFLHLLTELETEITRSALLASAGASIADALSMDRPGVTPRQFITFFPRESAVLMRASGLIARRYPHSILRTELSAFNSALAEAKAATLAFPRLLDPGSISDDPALQPLVLSWRHACAAAHRLLKELVRLFAMHGDPLAAVRAEPLLRALAAGMRGEAPFARDARGVALPEWSNRRGQPREKTCVPATLRIGGRAYRIIVRDRTETSLGISDAPPLTEGALVDIDLDGEAPTLARVVWSNGDRAGLDLCPPCAPSI